MQVAHIKRAMILSPLVLARPMVSVVAVQSGSGNDLIWTTIDSTGGASAGGGYSLMRWHRPAGCGSDERRRIRPLRRVLGWSERQRPHLSAAAVEGIVDRPKVGIGGPGYWIKHRRIAFGPLTHYAALDKEVKFCRQSVEWMIKRGNTGS
jgi:hypothetical protein